MMASNLLCVVLTLSSIDVTIGFFVKGPDPFPLHHTSTESIEFGQRIGNQEATFHASRFTNQEAYDQVDRSVEGTTKSLRSVEGGSFSRAEWKKKRYHMMQEVRKSIDAGEQSSVSKAWSMIDRWWGIYERCGSEESLKPTTIAFNVLLHALAKKGMAEEAEHVLRHEMIEKANLEPNIVSFATLMNAYARSRHGAKEAERILFEVIRRSESGSKLKVTTLVCDIVLNAWARERSWSGAERAELILRKMEAFGITDLKPTAHSYATVVDAWAKCGGGTEAAERAERILRGLIEGEDKKNADTVVFNACINAWASSRDPRAGSKAQALLKAMERLHGDKGTNCSADLVSYNSVLSAWSHSNHANAALQAESILKGMVTNHQANHTSPGPSVESFNNVLNAWSKSTLPIAVDRSTSILNFMLSPKSGKIEPDGYSFTSTLDVLAKSKEPDKAQKSKDLLEKLLQYSKCCGRAIEISQVPFNVVLNAAAFSKTGTTQSQRQDAIRVAIETFSLMKDEGLLPDEISYGNLLKAIVNLVPQGKRRNQMALHVFYQCCEDGQVGDLVWNEIRRAVPTTVLGSFTDSHLNGRSLKKSTLKDLPKIWTRNTKFAVTKCGRSTKTRNHKPTMKKPSSRPIQRSPTVTEWSFQSGKDL